MSRTLSLLSQPSRSWPLRFLPLIPSLNRRFTTSPTTLNSPTSTPPSTKDPQHPHLWYHPFPEPFPGRVVLSFLPNPPATALSRTAIGHLPMDGDSGLSDLVENYEFLKVLHASIKDGLAKGRAEAAEFEAQTRPTDGYIHITDERALPPAGRIGETEDLIGSVLVQDGKIVASTYEPLPSYRLVTSNGPLILPKGLAEHLIETLGQIDQAEKTLS